MIRESWQSISESWTRMIQTMSTRQNKTVHLRTSQRYFYQDIKKLMNANTFSNSQCSQSNVLLIIMNLTTNKTSGWYYDISSNESRFITKIASYLHPIEECQVVERRDSIPLMSETTIHDTCCQKHRMRSKGFVPFALHNDLLAVCGISTQWIMILRDIW